MSLIAIKCPSCGANVDVDPATKFGVCTFCDAAVTQNKIVVEHVNANTIATPEATLLRAQTLLKEGRYDEARKKFEETLDMDPHCSQAYIGALCASEGCPDLQTLAKTTTKYPDQNVLFRCAKANASEQEKEELVQYEETVNARLDPIADKMNSAFNTAIADAEEACGTLCQIYDTNVQEHSLTYAKRQKSLKFWEPFKKIAKILFIGAAVVAGLMIVSVALFMFPDLTKTARIVVSCLTAFAILQGMVYETADLRCATLESPERRDELLKERIDLRNKKIDILKQKYSSWLDDKRQTDYCGYTLTDDPAFKIVWNIMNGKYKKEYIEAGSDGYIWIFEQEEEAAEGE